MPLEDFLQELTLSAPRPVCWWLRDVLGGHGGSNKPWWQCTLSLSFSSAHSCAHMDVLSLSLLPPPPPPPPPPLSLWYLLLITNYIDVMCVCDNINYVHPFPSHQATPTACVVSTVEWASSRGLRMTWWWMSTSAGGHLAATCSTPRAGGSSTACCAVCRYASRR